VYLANHRLRSSRIYIVDLHIDDTKRKKETQAEYPRHRFDLPNSSSSIYYKTRTPFSETTHYRQNERVLKVSESVHIIPQVVLL